MLSQRLALSHVMLQKGGNMAHMQLVPEHVSICANGVPASARALHLRDRLRHFMPLGTVDLRPLWRGQAFERYADAPITIRRARALEAVLDNVSLPIREEECLVGTPAGALVEGLPPGIDQETLAHYRQINETVGERSFWTNFDHVAVDYAGLLSSGLPGRLAEVRQSQAAHTDPARQTFLESVAITLKAAIRFCRRWAAACREQVAWVDISRQQELGRMAEDLEAIASQAPATFSQAVQLTCTPSMPLAWRGVKERRPAQHWNAYGPS